MSTVSLRLPESLRKKKRLNRGRVKILKPY